MQGILEIRLRTSAYCAAMLPLIEIQTLCDKCFRILSETDEPMQIPAIDIIIIIIVWLVQPDVAVPMSLLHASTME